MCKKKNGTQGQRQVTTAGVNTYKTPGKSLCKTDKAFTWRQRRSLLSGSQSLHSRHVPWRPWVECSCNLEAKSQMNVINEIFFTISQDPRCISKRMQQLKVQPRLVDLFFSFLTTPFHTSLKISADINASVRIRDVPQTSHVGAVWPACVVLSVWALGIFPPASRSVDAKRCGGYRETPAIRVRRSCTALRRHRCKLPPWIREQRAFEIHTRRHTHTHVLFSILRNRNSRKRQLAMETVQFSILENPIVHVPTAAAGGFTDNVCVCVFVRVCV